jgi:hypothetical protein
MSKKLLALQFGNTYQRRAAGYALTTRTYKNPCVVWVDNVADGAYLNVDEALLEGYAGMWKPSELRIGLNPGTYHVTLTSFDPVHAHGPFSVTAGGSPAISGVSAPANEIVTVDFDCNVQGDVLSLRFVPDEGSGMVLNALVITGPDDAQLHPVFKTAPPIEMPDRDELAQSARNDPKAALKEICDWLVAHRNENGFLGDAWEGGIFLWYTASMPVRALLAGYDILGEAAYRDAAFRVLDLFAGEQLPSGAFGSILRGKPTSELSQSELTTVIETHGQPMSDIGSIVSALAIGSQYADSGRKERYVETVRHFCADYASLHQLPNGAFTDGPNTGLYSCATAIQAATFSLASAVTGDARFLDNAARAISFLLRDWLEDGRMLGRAPHWPVRNHLPFVMETLYFGDQWYYDEGFITTAYHAQDDDLRREIVEAIRRRLFGKCGLLTALEDRPWWPVQDIWNNAKSIGMVQTLLFAQESGLSKPALEEALESMQKVLSTPEYSRRLGVMAGDVEFSKEKYGFLSWSGMSIEATGFAGMTLAEMLKPGILYLG